jgi:hypothetical protein
MKQFENKSFIVLLYLIAGWCYANKRMPRKIDMWVEDAKDSIYKANVYHCQDKKQEIANVNKEETKCPTTKFLESINSNDDEQEFKRITNQYPSILEEILDDTRTHGYPDIYPILSEHNVSEEMDELTEAERAYSNHLKVNKLPKRGDATKKNNMPGYLQ